MADARIVWVRYYDGKTGKESVELCAVTHRGEVTVLNTKDIVRGNAQEWLSDGVCKRLEIKRVTSDAAVPKNDFQGL